MPFRVVVVQTAEGIAWNVFQFVLQSFLHLSDCRNNAAILVPKHCDFSYKNKISLYGK